MFVAGAALAEELCDERRFRKFVGGPIVEIRYAVHDSLFTAFDHEANWGVAHRIIAPHLSPDSVSAMFDAMRDATAELVEGWRGLVFLTSTVKKGNTVSPIAELNRLNLEVTTRTLYGKSLGGPDHPMIQAMEDATSEAMKRPTRPGFLNWLVYGGKFKRATDAMRTYAADMVKHRRDNPSTDRGDLLHALLNAKDPETGKALTDSQVIDEIVTMPIGSSTAPGLLSSALVSKQLLELFLPLHPYTLTRHSCTSHFFVSKKERDFARPWDIDAWKRLRTVARLSYLPTYLSPNTKGKLLTLDVFMCRSTTSPRTRRSSRRRAGSSTRSSAGASP